VGYGSAMRVLVTGATGMIGQGVLRECLGAEDVTEVVTVGQVGRAMLNVTRNGFPKDVLESEDINAAAQ
jgi:nucleoside-diphosphate-sugar epimerase